ncbi:hypothetical protein CC78DRAFT_539883 [Lojkania enalia]|uniref:Uncharacterized protein n=1 Tax=Lojkania enalia TaxID=147567 RepID=A0A9P4TNY8_9PLEO|nr:hypothetical protein CC78DRAFT_539883 [Didymosphaeria enalia]
MAKMWNLYQTALGALQDSGNINGAVRFLTTCPFSSSAMFAYVEAIGSIDIVTSSDAWAYSPSRTERIFTTPDTLAGKNMNVKSNRVKNLESKTMDVAKAMWARVVDKGSCDKVSFEDAIDLVKNVITKVFRLVKKFGSKQCHILRNSHEEMPLSRRSKWGRSEGRGQCLKAPSTSRSIFVLLLPCPETLFNRAPNDLREHSNLFSLPPS